MSCLHQQQDGLVLKVAAQPGARRNGITGLRNGALRVAVTQAAEKGKANKAVVEVLCKALDLRPSQMELITGTTSHQKRFVVRGIERAQLEQRIAQALQACG